MWPDFQIFLFTVNISIFYFTFLAVFKGVNLNCETNNTEHGTKKISKDQLIVRRGQRFTVKVELTQPFNPNLYPLTFTAVTGWSTIKWCFFVCFFVKNANILYVNPPKLNPYNKKYVQSEQKMLFDGRWTNIYWPKAVD